MKKDNRLEKYIILICDIFIVAIIFMILIYLGNPKEEFLERIIYVRKILYVPILINVVIMILTDMYNNIFISKRVLFLNCIISTFISVSSLYFTLYLRPWQKVHFNLSFYWIALVFLLFIFVERLVIRWVYKKCKREENLLIISSSEKGYKICAQLYLDKHLLFNISGLYFCNEKNIKSVESYIIKNDIVFIHEALNESLRIKLLNLCLKNNKKVYIVPTMEEISIMKPKLIKVDDHPFFYLDSHKMTRLEGDFKRLLDILISIIALVILSPIMLVCGIIIKTTSKGNVFFTQERLTINNKIFKVIKFRTMKKNAEASTGPILSMENDMRVTKFGKLLRSTRLDEIPQFFNVLIGDMSIIGPRPERPIFVKRFEKEIPLYEKRHHVKAGITGLAQIMGRYSTATFDKLRYDLIYINNYSIMLDVKILLSTIKVVFLDFGSYEKKDDIDYIKIVEESNIIITK